MDIWLFILGYLINFVGSLILLRKIRQQKSIHGLSIDMQICFLLSVVSRCIWSLDTKLIDTYLSYLELICSLAVTCILLYYMHKYRYTNLKPIWTPLRAYVLAPVTLLLAFLVHPTKDWISSQILVAFTIYIEAAALIPQLWLMHRTVEVESLTSHYVALLVVSRSIRILFWIQLYIQGDKFIGLLLADVFHTVFSIDFFVLWCRKLRHGGTLIYRA